MQPPGRAVWRFLKKLKVGAEEIEKRLKRYMDELYDKDLNKLDYYDSMVSHLEPDILECEVKRA